MTEDFGIITTPAIPQIRMGLIGKPGAGKTTACLTFPNPIILDKDRKCPPNVKAVPFYDPAFEKKFASTDQSRSGVRSALINWLNKYNDPSTTLILDSYTMWMNDFDKWSKLVGPLVFKSEKKPGVVDGFAIHADRIAMGVEIFHALKSMQNNFVVNFHEQVDRNEDGVPIGIRALIKGQFGDQVGAHLTIMFRAVCVKGKYLWQVVSDQEFTVIRPPEFNLNNLIENKYIEPTYNELIKRMTKV